MAFSLRQVFYYGVVILCRLSPLFLCVYSKGEANNIQRVTFKEYTKFLLLKKCDFPPKETYQNLTIPTPTGTGSGTTATSHAHAGDNKHYEYDLRSSLLVCSKDRPNNILCAKFMNLSMELCSQQNLQVLEKLQPEKLQALIENSTWNACEIINGTMYVSNMLKHLSENAKLCRSRCDSNESDMYYVCNFMVAALLAQWDWEVQTNQSMYQSASDSADTTASVTNPSSINLSAISTTTLLHLTDELEQNKAKNDKVVQTDQPSSNVATTVTVTDTSKTENEKPGETNQPRSTVTTTATTVTDTSEISPIVTSTARKTAADQITITSAVPTLVSTASTKENDNDLSDLSFTGQEQESNEHLENDDDEFSDESSEQKNNEEMDEKFQDGIQQSGTKIDKGIIDVEEGEPRGHFMAYFITVAVLCISGYVLYHNRQKILAFVLEGRRKAGQRRRAAGSSSGASSAKYSKLESAVDDVMPSFDKSLASKNYIY